MAKKKKPLPLLERIEITGVAAEGKALARVDDLVVFVPFVVPGDVVDLQVRRKKHSYAEAEAVKFHEYSTERAEPFCKHYGVCGGCKWQCLAYEHQLKYKQQQVFDALKRIGKVELPEFMPILGSEQTKAYRNKLEFTFSNKRWLTWEEVEKHISYEHMNALGAGGIFLFVETLSDQCAVVAAGEMPGKRDNKNHLLRPLVSPFVAVRRRTGRMRAVL